MPCVVIDQRAATTCDNAAAEQQLSDCNNIDKSGEPTLRLTLRCAHRAALLEAFAAEYRPALRRTERHRGVFAALRAIRFRFGAHRCATAAAIRAGAYAFRAFRFAPLASLGLVLEALVGEKHLFAGCEHKFRIAFRALQYFVVEFHEPPPLARVEREG
jgi:hypothetical protein